MSYIVVSYWSDGSGKPTTTSAKNTRELLKIINGTFKTDDPDTDFGRVIGDIFEVYEVDGKGNLHLLERIEK